MRRATAVTAWCWASALVTLGGVGVLVGFLVLRGGKALGPGLLFGSQPLWQALTGRVPVWDGIWPAVAGTGALVLLAGSLAVPVGIGAGLHLAEFARGRWKRVAGFAVDLLAGIPSIVMGLFGFALILFLRRTVAPTANASLLLAAGCIALLVLPYLIRTTQGAIEALPPSLRLAGASLGLTPWQNLVHVLVPAASRSLSGGVVLALGRAAEDTAVILLTGAVAQAGVPRALTEQFEALPFSIYYLSTEYRNPAELERAFATALVLLAVTGGLLLSARALRAAARRGREAGEPS